MLHVDGLALGDVGARELESLRAARVGRREGGEGEEGGKAALHGDAPSVKRERVLADCRASVALWRCRVNERA